MNASYVRFSRQAVVSTLASVSVYARTIILIPVMARGFSPADYGIWIQIYGAVELMVVIGSLGLQRSLIRFWHQSQISGHLARDLSTILFVVALACFLLAGAVVNAGELLTTILWDTPGASGHLDLFLILVPLTAFTQIILTAFRSEQRVAAHSVLLLCESVGFVTLTIWLLAHGGGVREALLALTATRLAVFVAGYVAMIRRIGWRWPHVPSLKRYLAFGLPLLPVGTFMWVSNMSDRYIISHYVGTEAVAQYSIHYSLGSLMGLFFSPVFFILVPAITHMWEQGNKDSIREYLLYAQKYPILVIAPVTVMLVLHTDWVISLVATDVYTCSPLVIVGVAAGVTLLNLAALAETIVCLVLRTRVIPLIYAATATCNVALNLFVIPIWGIRGAALVTAATYGLQFIAMHCYARRFFAAFLNWAVYLRTGVAAAAMYATGALVGDAVALSLPLSCGVYLVALVLTGSIERRELALIRAVFSRTTGATE